MAPRKGQSADQLSFDFAGSKSDTKMSKKSKSRVNKTKSGKTTTRSTTTVERNAGAKTKVVAGTAEYNNLIEWINSPKGSIEKALKGYDIDKATENIIRKSVK